MGYYHNEENVQQYIAMADGYDGRDLVAKLTEYLPAGSSVLELGMGPGKDLALLGEHFQVTGSDFSPVFVERYRAAFPAADVMLLDAATLETDRRFDAIYSNKVLYHLSRQQLAQSFQRQAALLNAGGILLHSFWLGEGEEEFSGLRSVYYTEEALREVIGDEYEAIEFGRYAEMEPDDSLYAVLKKPIDWRQ